MVNEVNKLIYNTIIKGADIYLPDVGTLCVVRHSATINSHNEVLPPHFDIELHDAKTAVSLVDIISSVASVDSERAKEIYDRWLEKSQKGSILVIDRVGTLDGKSFICDSSFIKAMNPNNAPMLITPRRNHRPLWIGFSLVTLIGALCCTWWYYKNYMVATEDIAELVTIVDNDIDTTQDNIVLAIETESIETIADEPQEIVTEETVVESNPDWRNNENIRHWVVVGSYSTTENAERAIAEISKRTPEAKCNYFRLGSMYAVATFGSDKIDDCQEYKRNHVEDFPQLWIYTPKKYK